MKVVLDKSSLFALASDTRMEMLKALESNRRTVSQLAELINIDKSAVYRHLKKLEEGGFVARTEDHGFVYYALTWRSRDILNPNDKTKIVILISSALICALALMLMAYLASSHPGVGVANSQTGTQGDPLVDQTSPRSDSSLAPSSPPVADYTIPSAVLAPAAVVFLCCAYFVWRTPRQRGGEEQEVPIVTGPLVTDDD
jgi:DNA-binding transcriptional ArsR family regulator